MKAIEKLKNQSKVKNDKKEPPHDFRTCMEFDCIECEALFDSDIIMACDGACCQAYLKTDPWVVFKNGETWCERCFEKVAYDVDPEELQI